MKREYECKYTADWRDRRLGWRSYEARVSNASTLQIGETGDWVGDNMKQEYQGKYTANWRDRRLGPSQSELSHTDVVNTTAEHLPCLIALLTISLEENRT